MAFNFSTFPTLKTERLLLREVQHRDAKDILVSFGDFEVQKYNGPVLDLNGVHDMVTDMRATYAKKMSLAWGITRQGDETVLGMVGLWDWNKYHRRAMLGYDLARVYWGNGFATEAITAVLRFAFDPAQMNLNRVDAYTIADNQGSVRLLERLGFTREGTRRGYSWEEDGTFHDSAIYGMLQAEWNAKQI